MGCRVFPSHKQSTLCFRGMQLATQLRMRLFQSSLLLLNTLTCKNRFPSSFRTPSFPQCLFHLHRVQHCDQDQFPSHFQEQLLKSAQGSAACSMRSITTRRISYRTAWPAHLLAGPLSRLSWRSVLPSCRSARQIVCDRLQYMLARQAQLCMFRQCVRSGMAPCIGFLSTGVFPSISLLMR